MTLKVRILQSLRRLFIILVGLTMTWFSEKMLISNICTHGLMTNLIKKSWTVSTSHTLSTWAVRNGNIYYLLSSTYLVVPTYLYTSNCAKKSQVILLRTVNYLILHPTNRNCTTLLQIYYFCFSPLFVSVLMWTIIKLYTDYALVSLIVTISKKIIWCLM